MNGYQSLHTTLVGPYGTPVEFQFRTRDMHHVAEEGVASHWLYKGADLTLNDLQKRTHQWLQSLLDIQSQTGDSGEFLEHVKVDLFPDAVYVFTPRGKIISLPRGAPVDFAYAIHTDIGNQAVAAKVNGEFVPLRTEMSSGDTVEIVTSPASRPNAQWLNYVRTGRARSEIRHYLRTVKYEESVAFGERLLGQAMQELHMPLPATDDPAWQKLARSTGASSREEILADIGLGKPGRRGRAPLRARAGRHHRRRGGRADLGPQRAILIQGNEGQAVQLAPCCGPPRRPHHRRHAHGPRSGRAHRRLPGGHAPAPARTGTLDQCGLGHAHGQAPRHPPGHRHAQRARRAGRLAAEVTAADANIVHVTMHDDAVATVSLHLTIQVDSRKHLAQVIRAIRHVPQVQKIVRVRVTHPEALRASSETCLRTGGAGSVTSRFGAPVLVAVCFLLPTDSCSCPACPAVQTGLVSRRSTWPVRAGSV